VSARKIGFLILILVFGAVVETAWNLRESRFAIGPEGCRVLGGRFYGPSFDFEERVRRPLTAPGVPEIEVVNAFGSVHVLAGDGPGVEVKLRKVVFLPTEERARTFAGRVELRLEEDEGRLRVGTNREDLGREESVGFETHLELHVPPEAKARILCDHGPVVVSGIGGADVRTTFDEVRADEIAGPVRIDVRDGRVEVHELGAGLTLKGRHVEADVAAVEGEVNLDLQHGRLTLRRAGALLAKLSHVEVVVEGVEGDVTIDARNTAATAIDVGGRVEVETSFGDVRVERVGGDVRAKADRGAVSAQDVEGAVSAEATYEKILLARIGGPVEAVARHGDVSARTLEGGIRVRATGGDVTIEGFRRTVDVEVERGPVSLTPDGPISEPINASSRGGEVHLTVPPGSRFELEAESRQGEVNLDVPGLEVTDSEPASPARAFARLGGGGPRVRLVADDDVTVEAGAASLPAEQP
jgi:hypothetical protein